MSIENIKLDDDFYTELQVPSEISLQSELEKCRITPDEIIPPPPICIKLENRDGSHSMFGTLGNISTIIGKAKSKKSFSVALVVSAALSNETLFDKITGCLPFEKRNVLYFDTEQGKYHVQLAVKRICQLANVTKPENLHVFGLRSNNPAERLQLVEHAITTIQNVGFVVIDGIKDLITSINDEEQATMIVSKLMKWSAELDIHIVNILHQNKGNEHARGHIGSEMINKSESVFSVTKSSDNKDISIFEAEFCRGKEPEPFAFRVNEFHLPEIINDYTIGAGKKIEEEFTNHKLWFLLSVVYSKDHDNIGFGYSELVRQFKIAYNKHYSPSKIGDNKIKDLITICKNDKMIIQEAIKKPYQLNREYTTEDVASV